MSAVGELVRTWRLRRRMSQSDLAEQAEVSTRHLSFLETGKARPSRQMVLVLGSALDLPLRARNTLLVAGGFAPAYQQTDLDAPEMAGVRAALDLLLDQPFPSVVLDRTWNVVRPSPLMAAMAAWMLPHRPLMGANLLESLFDPERLRQYIGNWHDTARTTLDRLHREAVASGDEALHDLHARLLAYPDVPSDWRTVDWEAAPALMIPLQLRKEGASMAFFTTITTLGTALDVTLAELRIESYFPADDATRKLLAAFAGS